jgi:TetR/AcrR family transcriptional regulator, cholesterol catabolism regulator
MPVKRQRTRDPASRRAQIFGTAAQIFRDRGFDGTSVGDVARALRMTKAGLYHYVPSKEALLFEILSFGLDQVRDEVAEPARKVRDPEARLRDLVVRHARIITRTQGAMASLVDETRALPAPERRRIEERMRMHFDLMRNTIAELETAGRLRDVDVTVAAFSVLGMIFWLPRWFHPAGRLTEGDVAEQIANIALGGLLKPPPARRSSRQPVSRRRRHQG